MNKKKILIVSSGFYPLNSPRSFRTTELANELARQGHEVVVYFPFRGYDYSGYAKTNSLIVKDLGALKFKSIRLKGSKLEMFLRRGLRRIFGLFIEYPDIELMFRVSKCLKNETVYDLLISIAKPFPIHWGVAKARTRAHRIADIWVADCGDPYMGEATDSFSKMFYFKYVEKWFCRKADYITIPFEGATSAYYSEFHNKIRIIPQGFRLDNIELPKYNKNNQYPVFAYAGRIIPGRRDPRSLLEFLSSYNNEFRFYIYTDQPDIIMPHKNILGDKLIIKEFIPREELLANLARMDFLLNFDNNVPTQLPSKLIDYAITGRPVLNVTQEIDYSKVLEFLDGNYTRKLELGNVNKYDIKEVAKQFLEIQNIS